MSDVGNVGGFGGTTPWAVGNTMDLYESIACNGKQLCSHPDLCVHVPPTRSRSCLGVHRFNAAVHRFPSDTMSPMHSSQRP